LYKPIWEVRQKPKTWYLPITHSTSSQLFLIKNWLLDFLKKLKGPKPNSKELYQVINLVEGRRERPRI